MKKRRTCLSMIFFEVFLYCLVIASPFLDELTAGNPFVSFHRLPMLVLIVEILIVASLVGVILNHYGNWRRQRLVVTGAAFMAWYFSQLIIFLLPVDVSSVSLRVCATSQDFHFEKHFILLFRRSTGNACGTPGPPPAPPPTDPRRPSKTTPPARCLGRTFRTTSCPCYGGSSTGVRKCSPGAYSRQLSL